jgi:hypothetical protein
MVRTAWSGVSPSLIVLLATLVAAPPAHAASRLDPWRCPVRGAATADNDMRLEGDPRPKGVQVEVPTVIADQVRAVAANWIRRRPELAEGLKCDELLRHPVYRISLGGGRYLYVAEVSLSVGPDFFLLTAYDEARRQAGARPVLIGAKWPQGFGAKDRLVRRPFVREVHWPGSDRPIVVFEERVHNGSLYNGVIDHYFEVDPDLGLNGILAVERTVIVPEGPQNRRVRRELSVVGPNRLRLDVRIHDMDKAGRDTTAGHVLLARPGPGSTFRVIESRTARGFDPRGLMTFCEQSGSNEHFFSRGCDFYY